MKSALWMSLVVARNPAVLMVAPRQKMMPSPLTTNTRPLAISVPRIWVGPRPPVTRLSATAELLGWLKVVVSPTPMLNVFQLMIAFWLDWLIVAEFEPGPTMVALPPTTVPP